MSDTQIIENPKDQELAPLTIADVRGQINLIQNIMRDLMKESEHYGTIPGCGDKKVLFKSGAEKLCLTFKLAPRYELKETLLANGHFDCNVVCNMYHAPSGRFLGAGIGSCSTMETKYRWRDSQRKCPACGKEAIIKSKKEYGGGWLCFEKKGGCKAKFREGAPEIEGQTIGRIENQDVADTYNTVRKMAKKRALVDATLTVTAASDIFTQDLEDTPPEPAPVVKATATVVSDAISIVISDDQRRELIIAAKKCWGDTYEHAFRSYLKTEFGTDKTGELSLTQYREAKEWLLELAESAPEPAA